MTQQNIYSLFAFYGKEALSKLELMNALTLVRKVTNINDFAALLFFVYTKDKKHEKMMEKEAEFFEEEN